MWIPSVLTVAIAVNVGEMQALRERRPHRVYHTPPPAQRHDVMQPGSPLKHSQSSTSIYRRFGILYLCIAIQTVINFLLAISLLSSRWATTLSPVHANSPSTPAHSQKLGTSPSASSSSSSTRYDCYVTIYAYDRPKHLLKLLRDIAREADAAQLSVGVNVIDDNSYGCQFDPVKRNVFQLNTDSAAQNDKNNHINDNDVLVRVPLPDTLPCAASHRFAHVEQFVHTRQWSLHVSKYRHGRRRYWHLVSQAHHQLRYITAQYYLFLPDDDRLSHGFFPSVINIWRGISDSRKLTLMLHVEATREHVAVWTDVIPRRVEGKNVSRIGWVESGNFICTRELLTFLNWSFPAIPPRRWLDNPPISSGVGATLSQLIHVAHHRMYRTDKSFVAHVGVTLSKMNAQFRQPNVAALQTKYYVDGEAAYDRLLEDAATVTASMASHWVREASLHAAVHSLATQVDHLNVYLNGYDDVPAFLHAPFITAVLGNENMGKGGSGTGDLGDVGKFFWANNLTTEFHATVDDDIIYPPDYVARLLAFREQFHPPVVVGVHGIRLRQEVLHAHLTTGQRRTRHGQGYYASREVWMATEKVEQAVNVHIIGTGTMLYKADEIGALILRDTFPSPNMADVWFGLLAQRLQMPMVIMPHEAGWLAEVPGTFDDSIYKRATKRRSADRQQTQAVLSIPDWRVFPPQPAKQVL